MRILAIVTALLAAVASIAVVLFIRMTGTPASHVVPQASPSFVLPSRSSQVAASGRRVGLGIVTYNLAMFEQETKTYPSLTVKYLSWGSPFPAAEILADHGLGIIPVIVLEPRKVSLPGIAAGLEDSYLASWASADRKLGLPIILSFAPEANGGWYPWGAGHISPVLYRTMWHHVHDVLIRDGARHIKWLWQVDHVWATSEPLSLLWPGRAYVNAVGIDGQLKGRGASYAGAFALTVAQIRAITSRPVMLSEVSVPKGPSRPAEVASLFSAAYRNHLTAVILFDVHRFNFDHDLATLAALRAAASRYR